MTDILETNTNDQEPNIAVLPNVTGPQRVLVGTPRTANQIDTEYFNALFVTTPAHAHLLFGPTLEEEIVRQQVAAEKVKLKKLDNLIFYTYLLHLFFVYGLDKWLYSFIDRLLNWI